MNYIANPDDPNAAKGAVEPFRPEDDADGNVASFNEQLDHRFQDPLNKSSDSGMEGTGQTAEFSMETQSENQLEQDTVDPLRPRETDADAEADMQDQGPGEIQRRNQGDQKDDPLAA
jgi:hypothetical protein